jgi:anaerobic ribonucleoside-triphosphate reductase activating protein
VLNIARTLPSSAVNGPGERYVIWVQGCSLRCPHCWNPDTWSQRPNTTVSPLDLVKAVLVTPDIEGVTLTGGEPFQQAGELSLLAAHVRLAGRSVMAYTGYELSDLRSEDQRLLLAQCDVVVAGAYIHERRSLGLPWRGSSNQTVHFLTDRYGPADMQSEPQCEVYVAEDGGLTFTGFPPPGLVG